MSSAGRFCSAWASTLVMGAVYGFMVVLLASSSDSYSFSKIAGTHPHPQKKLYYTRVASTALHSA